MNQLSRRSLSFIHPGPSFSGRWLLAVMTLSAAFFLPLPGSAHYLMLKRDNDPTNWQEHLDLTPPYAFTMFAEETATIIVEDAGGCNAWVWATVTENPLLIGLDPEGKEAEQFGALLEIAVIAGAEIGTAVIKVEWEGEHTRGAEGFCQEIAAVSITVDVIERPMETTAANIEHGAPAGDPVETQTGEFYFYEEPDLNLGGPMPLYFQRYYSSKMRQAHIVGDLGDNWRHNFEWSVHWNGNNLVLVTGNGKVLRYLKENDDWTLLTPTENRYQILQSNGAITVGDARANRIYSFNPEGRLIEVSDGRGNRHKLTYSGGKLAEVWDHPDPHSGQRSREILFGYDNDTGKLHSISERFWNIPGRGVGFMYEGANLTEVQDRGNNYTQYVYDTDHADPGLLRFISTPENRTAWFQSYNELGKVDEQSDIFGNTFSFHYDPPLNPTTTAITDPYGRETAYHFDDNGSGALIGVTDPLGRHIDIGVNDRRLRNQIVTREGAFIQRDYHPETGAVIRTVDENGREMQLTYTPRTASGIVFQDLTRIDYADGAFATFAYNSSGHMTSRTDQTGHSWTFTYNGFGQVLTATNPLGAVTTFAYDAFRNPAIIEDPDGNRITFNYDDFQRMDIMSLGDYLTTRQITYDDYDRLLSMLDERGNTFTRAYDLDGRLIRATDAEGNVTEFEYNDLNQLVRIIRPEGNPVLLTYERFGRVASITLPNGNIITYAYDEVGRLASVSDSLGTIREQTTNADGWITGSSNALAAATSLTRDPAGLITGALSPEGRAVTIAYDRLNRPVSGSLGGLVNHITRDARGFITDFLLPGGFVSAQYGRNALGNLTTVTDPLGNGWIRTYDGQGRLASTIDPLGNVTSYTRDSRHRVIEIELPLSNVTLTRDPSGNVTRRLYSDGTDLTYSYDNNHRLTTATGLSLAYDANGRIVESNGLQIQRDASGQISRITFAPGKFVDYTYNLRNQVTGLTDWLGGETGFAYDAAGRLTGIVRPNAVNTLYAYDSDGLLVSVQEQHGGTTLASSILTRNSVGQIQSAARTYPPGTSFPQFSPSEAIATYDDASQVSGYLYDAMGRRLADASYDYEWDLASRLISSTDDGPATSFTYDALGQLGGRTGDGVTRAFTWNYALGLPSIGIVRENDVAARYYVHTPGGRLLYSIDAATEAPRYYHFDEMGNTTLVTDASASVNAAYRYAPYGEIVQDSSGGALDNLFTYQGRWGMMREGESGLYYTRARWYDAANAQFLSRDPVKLLDPRTINPYQYAALNPLLYVDPSGREPERADLVTLKGEDGFYSFDITGRPGAVQAAALFFPAEFSRSLFSNSRGNDFDSEPLTWPDIEEPSSVVSVLDDLTPGVLLDNGDFITFPANGGNGEGTRALLTLPLPGGPSWADHLSHLGREPFAPAPPRGPKPPALFGHASSAADRRKTSLFIESLIEPFVDPLSDDGVAWADSFPSATPSSSDSPIVLSNSHPDPEDLEDMLKP